MTLIIFENNLLINLLVIDSRKISDLKTLDFSV